MCVQDDRSSHRRLEDDAPGDAELGGEVVGAGGKDDAADGGVGECTGQACAVAHLRRGPAIHAIGAKAAVCRILRSGSAIVAITIRGVVAGV